MSDPSLGNYPNNASWVGEAKLQEPPKPKWSFSVNGTNEVLFNVPSAPNIFHRFMQHLLLGIVWKRIP
jgi:hypothetical protein